MADEFISVGSLTQDDLDLARKAGFDLSGYLPEDAVTREDWRAVTPEDTSVSAGDVGRALGAGAAGVASSLGAATEYITGGAYGADTRRYFEDIAREQVGGMSPYSRRAFQAEFLPEAGGTSVLDNLSASLGLKTVAAIPSVVSSIIPAGLAARALSGFGTAVRAGAATGAARATAGTLTGGEIASQVYSSVERLGDEELQGLSPIYAGYRSMMDEAEARRLFMQDVAGAAPVVGFALSAATGGIEGQVARRLGGEAAKGFMRGAAKGAGAEALQESLESGGGELLAQLQLADANLAQMNWRKILSQTIEGGVLGAAIGAPIGGVSGIQRGEGVTTVPPLQPDPAQAAALTTEVAPPPLPPPAAPPAAEEVVAPPPAPASAPAAAPAAPAAPSPREPTVLETPRTLEEQVRDLEDGIRPVALFPVGTKVADRPPMPEGMKLATVKGLGVVYYNPDTGLVGKDFQSMNEATLGKLLNMSGTTKDDVLAAIGRGAQPAVVTVRRGQTPVVDQVTSTETLARDAAAVQAQARPGDTVEVRTPEAVVAERQAPPPRFPVRPTAPKTMRSEQAFITPEMRRAYLEETTRVDAQGRRILPDMSAKAIRAFYEARTADRRLAADEEQAFFERRARAAQQELDAQRQEAAESEAPKAPIVNAPDKKGKAYQERVDAARAIIEANQPSDAEKAGFSDGAKAEDRVKARALLIKRLDAIIDQARAQKVAIPDRWRDGTPDYLGWLRAIADAKKGIKEGKGVSAIIQRYTTDEYFVSQQDFEAVKKRRRGEAEGKFGQGEVRQDQTAEPDDMSVDVEPTGRVRETSVEDEADPTEVFGQTNIQQDAEPEADEAALSYEAATERPTPQISENELLGDVVTQGRSKAGEFKVERKGAALRPKVEGKITLKPKAAAAVAAAKKTEGKMFLGDTVSAKDNVVYDTWESRQDRLQPVPENTPRAQAVQAFYEKLSELETKAREDRDYSTSDFLFGLMERIGNLSTSRDKPAAILAVIMDAANIRLSARYGRPLLAMTKEADAILGENGREGGRKSIKATQDFLRAYGERLPTALRTSLEGAIKSYEAGEVSLFNFRDAALRGYDDAAVKDAGLYGEVFNYNDDVGEIAQSVIAKDSSAQGVLQLPDYQTGKPVVADAFHGTGDIIAKFDPSARGAYTGAASAKEAFFFARNPATSNRYASPNAVARPKDRYILAALRDLITFGKIISGPPGTAWVQNRVNMLSDEDRAVFNAILDAEKNRTGNYILEDAIPLLARVEGGVPNIMMSRIYFKNPLVVDQKGERYRETSYYHAIKRAKDEGHDGVILLNTFDGGPQDVIYAVFDADKISDRFNPAREGDQIFPVRTQPRQETIQDTLYGNAPPDQQIVEDFTIRSGTVAEMMRAVKIGDLAKFVEDNKLMSRLDQRLQRALAPQMMRALRQLVPNVRVNIISDDGYALVAPPDTLGYYDKASDSIVISERAAQDSKTFAWAIAHEAAHAAFSKAIANSPILRLQVVQLMEYLRPLASPNYPHKGAFTKDSPIRYGFKNVDEFISEAWSNPAFQRLLATTPIPQKLADMLGIRPAQRSMVRTLWDWLRFKVASVLNMPTNRFTAFDAVMRVSEDLQKMSAEARANAAKSMDVGKDFLELPNFAQKTQQELSVNLGGKLRRGKNALKTMTMIARDMVDGLWKGTDLPLRAAKLRRSMDVMKADILQKTGGEKLIQQHAELERANPKLYEQMADLGYRYTVIDANPGGPEANKHMGKKRKYAQARLRLAELDSDFAALQAQDPRYAALLLETSRVFKSIQNDVSLKVIQNLLNKVGVNEPGLAERIYSDGLTDADKKKFKTNATVKALDDARMFEKINGIYLPEMRRGDFIVNGRYNLEKDVPSTAIQLDQDTLLFTGNGNLQQAERDADAFLRSTDLMQSSAREIYVDKNDPEVELNKEDVDAVPALRVRMQTQFTSFVDSEAEALSLVNDLKADGALDARYQIKREAIGEQSKVIPADMKRIESALKKSENFKNLSDGEKQTTLQAMRELALRLDGDGRLGHRRMKRRNVAGFSKDLLANTQVYLDQASGYLARLEYQPQIDAAVDEMDKFIQSRSDMSAQDVAKMREQYNTLVDRLYRNELPQTGATSNIVRRLLQISMLNKLAGISYNVVNAHEPWLIGAPYLSGRFNPIEVVRAMGRAYNQLGVGGAVGKGIVDMARALRQDRGFTNFQDYFVERYGATKAKPEDVANFKDMLSYLHSTGLFDREAGMEVTRVNDPTSNIIGRGLDRAELMFRQVAATIEAINRVVVAKAAYDLEFARTEGNHEAAKSYAYDAVHDTMGDYSATNASPLFNSQLGRLALQFKKFAQKTYWLLGRTIAHMFRGDREAMRQFAGLMLTTGVVTGILGLPLEPIKIALLASGALLGTGFSYDDFEDLIRRTAAGVLGVKGGEVFTRGIYRTIDIEVANRMGLDSLLTFGQPRSQSQQDLKAWLFDTAGGAPVGTVMSQIASLNTFLGAKSGDDYLKALEQSMAPKAITDITKAYRGYTVGKESASGRQTLEPYTLTEAAAKAIGFTPAREYEQQRLRASVTDKDKQQQSERTKFNQQWYKAGPAERAKLWGQIEKWNQERPKEARITRSSLDAYVRRRNTEEESGSVVNGIRVNKNTRSFFEEGQRTYNVTR